MSGSPSPPGSSLSRDLLARLPADDPVLEADRRHAARVLAERARIASDSFRKRGADWDEAHALALPVDAIEHAVLDAVGDRPGRLLDIGTGTGRLLERLAPRVDHGVGIDASRAMLALARSRLSKSELAHCAVRQADMYRLPMADGTFDTAILQMVLHYAEDPAAALTEAARVLRPDGQVLVVDLVQHDRTELTERLAHRWPGFDDPTMATLMRQAGLVPGTPVTVPGALPVRLWPGIPAATSQSPARIQKEFA